MQTFITDLNLKISAQNLDRKRLGKQRVEAIQIASCLLDKKEGWKNHPAVLMWKEYVPFLVEVYLKSIIDEWVKRGYKNEKCSIHFQNLSEKIHGEKIKKPWWFNQKFVDHHRSSLINKNPEYYTGLWPHAKINLPDYWPVQKQTGA